MYLYIHAVKTQQTEMVHAMPAEFENGTKFLRLGVAFTRYRHEKM